LCFAHHLGICSNALFVVELRGVMNLPEANCVRRALRHAKEQRTSLVVIEMHTPGRLDPSMRKIIQDIPATLDHPPFRICELVPGKSTGRRRVWELSCVGNGSRPWLA
jgi:hypothetical protein